jgi:hypothetical protein
LPGGVTDCQLEWNLGIVADLIVTTDVITDGFSNSEIQQQTNGIVGSFANDGVAGCSPYSTQAVDIAADAIADAVPNVTADVGTDGAISGETNHGIAGFPSNVVTARLPKENNNIVANLTIADFVPNVSAGATTDSHADGVFHIEPHQRVDVFSDTTASSAPHFATDNIANNHADYLPDRHADGVSNGEPH